MNNINFSHINDNLTRFVHRYLWDPEPRNTDLMNSIYLLGYEYRSSPPPAPPPPTPALSTATSSVSASESAVQIDPSEVPSSQALQEGITWSSTLAQAQAQAQAQLAWPSAFLDDFGSRVWMTYRSDFPPIPRTVGDKAEWPPSPAMTLLTSIRAHLPENREGFTSDSGWGCMIRSAQSVLANALFNLHLGRDWRRGEKQEQERKLLSLFADDPRAPFSIHKFAAHGETACGVCPGEWFGPSAAARCIQALTNGYKPAGLRVYVTQEGGDVYKDAFFRVAKPDGDTFHPTLILVAIRLGITGVTPVYWEALKAALEMKFAVGIAGGRPSSSHYFIGHQGQNFFYMDPHLCRPTFPYKANSSEYTEEEIDSCYTKRLRVLDVKEMDPSMLLAFLVRDEEEWNQWTKSVARVQGKSVVVVGDVEPKVGIIGRGGGPRAEAVDEVESFTEDEDSDGDLV